MEKLILIKTLSQLQDLQVYLKDKEFIAFDTETNGVEKDSRVIGFSVCADTELAYYVILSYWDNEHKKLVDLETVTEAKDLLQSLVGRSLIMQNAPFDCRMVYNNFKVSLIDSVHTDTLILGHLLNENRQNGLKELGEALYGQDARKEQEEMKASVHRNGGKLTKDQYELYKADADLLGKYGAKDAILTLKLFYDFVPELYKQNLDKFFYDEESMPLLRGPTYEMNDIGLRIDPVKLQALKGSLQAECMELKAAIYNEILPHVKDKYPGTKKANTFNIGAPQQLSWLLFHVLNNDFGTLTDSGREMCKAMGLKPPYALKDKREFVIFCNENKGRIWAAESYNPKTRKKVKPKKVSDSWKYMSSDADCLEPYSKKYKWVERLLKYAKTTKLLGTYVGGIEERMRYNIINPSFLQHGTTSGRYSCIAEGQTVSMPGGDKLIEEVRVGDYVYCYSQSGEPTVSKVLNVFNNGVQECVEMTWRSKGTHKEGTLVCTPDHKIKTKSRGWVRADRIRKRESVYHLRRGKSPVSERLRVYGSDYFMVNEEVIVKKQLLGGNDRDHVHHKNENKTDNRVENLQILSPEEHLKLHTQSLVREGRIKWEHLKLYKHIRRRGSDHHFYKAVTKFSMLRMLARAGGRASKVPLDFDTVTRKCKLLGIDPKAVKARYTSKGLYITRRVVENSILSHKKVSESATDLGISLYRLKSLCEKYDIVYNHKMVNLKRVGLKQVYDLEVETHHNFIVNEICVHNCKNPNFQNLPRDDKRIKECIVSRPGKVFVGADYSQLEPRVFASVSKDETLLASFAKGEDFYSVVGAPIFSISDTSMIKSDENSFANKHPKLRNIAKAFALATPYGTSAFQQSQMLDLPKQECQDIIDRYFQTYPKVELMMLEAHEKAKRDGIVYSLYGRPRRIPDALEIPKIYGAHTPHSDLEYPQRTLLNLGMNHQVQSSAASIVNRAMISFNEVVKEVGLTQCHIVLQVHDEIVVECREQDASDVALILKDCMENTTILPGVQLIAQPVIANNLADLK